MKEKMDNMQVSRFKNRKFEVIGDSNGTNFWVPVEQAKQLLCDAMAIEAENERLRKAGDAMAESINYDDQRSWEDWGNKGKSLLRNCVINWEAAKKGRDAK